MTANLVGLVALLALMMATIRFMIVGPRRSDQRARRRAVDLITVASWVPAGFAGAKLAGEGAPLVAVLMIGFALAVAHHYLTAPYEVFVGGAAFVVTAIEATTGTACRDPLGAVGAVVFLGFGGTAALFALGGVLAFSRASIGSMVVASVAALELVLFAVSPVGGVIFDYRPGPLPILAVLAAVYLPFLVMSRVRLGLAVLGVALVAAELVIATAGGPCIGGAMKALVGCLAFTVVRSISTRSPAVRVL